MTEIKESISLAITREKDMIFRMVSEHGNYQIYIDKTNKDRQSTLGPTPSRMLAAALLGCLSSSLVLCIEKAGLELDDLESRADFDMVKDEKGFIRIHEINVTIKVQTDSPVMKKRLKLCRKYFEEQCTVTAALRSGIKINTPPTLIYHGMDIF